MRIAVAQLGARMHYAVPRIFHEAGMLERLFTDAYIGNKPWLERGLRSVPQQLRHAWLQQWLGRKEDSLPPELVKSFDLLGLAYRQRLRRGSGSKATRSAYIWAGEVFGRRVVESGFGRADTVWSFNGTSLEIFQAAKAQGLRCIVEQIIAPSPVQVRVLRSEIERWPGWQPDLMVEDDVSEGDRRRAAEWQLADLIVCGSQFVVDGIAESGGPVEKCRVVPYGVDLEKFRCRPPRHRGPDEPLRVLFAGEVGLRKGVPWLLEAARKLGPDRIDLKLAGHVTLARDKTEPYRDVATFLGPAPRSRMPDLFAWADLFVLPSACEGSATVTYEAVASGLPVIATPNAGALETEAVTIVSFADADALAGAIADKANAPILPEMSPATRWHYGLEAYANRLLEAVGDLDRHSSFASITA